MKIRNIIIAFAALAAVCSCSGPSSADGGKMGVIFETDMGNDIDDALALDMLYKYMDAGKIELLGIMSNKNSPYSAEFIDVMGTWYGYPDVPVGIVRNGADSSADGINPEGETYVQAVCGMADGGVPVFKRSIADYNALPDAHMLYRKLLAAQPDSSVTIVSVGFSTNLARLLDTPADGYSPLTGRELVEAKVRKLSVMACNFENERDLLSEYNVNRDIASAQKLFAECPAPIVVSPFEVGIGICYPAESIENDFNWGVPHPMVEAYKAYLPMPYDRPTWDLTSVLYAVDPQNFFGISPLGTVSIADDGLSTFTPDAAGKHRVLNVNDEQRERIKDYFVKLVSQKPAKLQK